MLTLGPPENLREHPDVFTREEKKPTKSPFVEIFGQFVAFVNLFQMMEQSGAEWRKIWTKLQVFFNCWFNFKPKLQK